MDTSFLSPLATVKVIYAVMCVSPAMGAHGKVLTTQDGALSVHIAVLLNTDFQATHTTRLVIPPKPLVSAT